MKEDILEQAFEDWLLSVVVIKLVSFKDIFTKHFIGRVGTTVESSGLGRLIQIIRTAGIKLNEELV